MCQKDDCCFLSHQHQEKRETKHNRGISICSRKHYRRSLHMLKKREYPIYSEFFLKTDHVNGRCSGTMYCKLQEIFGGKLTIIPPRVSNKNDYTYWKRDWKKWSRLTLLFILPIIKPGCPTSIMKAEMPLYLYMNTYQLWIHIMVSLLLTYYLVFILIHQPSMGPQ